MTRFVYDPDLPWDGPFPYRTVARLGLTPASTANDVLDASYVMVAQAAADATLNEAWETLRLIPRRLVVDFFCYAAEDPAEGTEPAITGVPWELIEALDQIREEITLPARAPREPQLPAELDRPGRGAP